MKPSFTIIGNYVDVVNGVIRPSSITVTDGIISEIREVSEKCTTFLTPGFVDAHVHIESSMLAPTAFAQAAVINGVIASVSDPHEIANVLGADGVRWMVANARRSPFKFHFGAPSCVPATPFETAGASLSAADIADLLDNGGVHYLAEVMNFPAVIQKDPAMLAILETAKQRGLRIDGHAPSVMGEALKSYASAGIESDHECVNEAEARARIAHGMFVAIREGSAARNFSALAPVLLDASQACFFCSDDKHPDDLVRGYLNEILARAVALGVPPLTALRVASLNPVRHYRLPVGLLQVGEPADFLEIEDLKNFRVMRTWIQGELVAENGKSLIPSLTVDTPNVFNAKPITANDLSLPWKSNQTFPTIIAYDGQLITGREDLVPRLENGNAVSDVSRDMLKIAVVNRYHSAKPVVGFIRNFGLTTGALAGSVAHDSHNIVAVGADDASLVRAINRIIAMRGGLSFTSPQNDVGLPLPIAGLMSDRDAWSVATDFEKLTTLAKEDGCPLRSPYMTLSFMALLVIPSLKIGDKGIFDVDTFSLLTL